MLNSDPPRRLAQALRQHLRSSIALITVSAWLGGIGALYGQSDYGGIVRGQIRQDGAPVANVKVTLEDENRQQYEPVFTNQVGVYVLTGVKPGNYTLLVWPRTGPVLTFRVIANPDLTDVNPIELPQLSGAETPPVRERPQSPSGPISPDEARAFVKNFWEARTRGDLTTLMASFFDRVDYYQYGVLELDAIETDQRNYLSAYSQRRFDIQAIDVIQGDERVNSKYGPAGILVRFSFRYLVSGQKQHSGVSVERWVLVKQNTAIKIIDCKAVVMRD